MLYPRFCGLKAALRLSGYGLTSVGTWGGRPQPFLTACLSPIGGLVLFAHLTVEKVRAARNAALP